MWFRTSTSDRPRDAPQDFAQLPAVVELSYDTWQGSAIQPSDVLDEHAARWHITSELFVCAACQSTNVRCIYLHYFHHMNESDVRVELVCDACGKFTHHEFSR